MKPIYVNRGDTVDIEWGFAELGLSVETFRTTHLLLEVEGIRASANQPSNTNGGIRVDPANEVVSSTIDSSPLANGEYGVKVAVTPQMGGTKRLTTHKLTVYTG